MATSVTVSSFSQSNVPKIVAALPKYAELQKQWDDYQRKLQAQLDRGGSWVPPPQQLEIDYTNMFNQLRNWGFLMPDGRISSVAVENNDIASAWKEAQSFVTAAQQNYALQQQVNDTQSDTVKAWQAGAPTPEASPEVANSQEYQDWLQKQTEWRSQDNSLAKIPTELPQQPPVQPPINPYAGYQSNIDPYAAYMSSLYSQQQYAQPQNSVPWDSLYSQLASTPAKGGQAPSTFNIYTPPPQQQPSIPWGDVYNQATTAMSGKGGQAPPQKPVSSTYSRYMPQQPAPAQSGKGGSGKSSGKGGSL